MEQCNVLVQQESNTARQHDLDRIDTSVVKKKLILTMSTKQDSSTLGVAFKSSDKWLCHFHVDTPPPPPPQVLEQKSSTFKFPLRVSSKRSEKHAYGFYKRVHHGPPALKQK